jgi:gamma-glutamyltranspeptidase / glutathione hydrolase
LYGTFDVNIKRLIAALSLTLVISPSGSQLVAPDTSIGREFLSPEPPSGYAVKNIAYAHRDMVAAANPLAVEVGVGILAQGGSAVDAAIAVQMVLNLVEPQSSGIGGGAFLLHHDASSKETVAYDGRETAPAAATANMFTNDTGRMLAFRAAVDSGLSVGTPGLLRMLELAHQQHGKLPWANLFAPAIKLSEDGFKISERLRISIAGSAARIQAQGVPVASYFLNTDGSAKATGTVLKNPEFATTLRVIASGGSSGFYAGAIAQAIVDKVGSHPSNPGRLAMSDLAEYQAKVRKPLCADYRARYTVCGMPPPSSGGIAVLQTLGMLNHFNLAKYPPNSVDAIHVISEAYRLAYADRAKYVADSDFVNVPTDGLIDPVYLKARSGIINLERSMGTPVAGSPAGALAFGKDESLNLPSTSHISIADSSGNIVAMTTSIENGFGSLQMVKGFLLNNQLTDFSFVEKDAAGQLMANRIEPGKRPRSAMSPTIVFNNSGQVEAVLGSTGGGNIIQHVTKTIVGLVDWKMNIQQAISLSNFGAQASATTLLEKGSLAAIKEIEEGLKAKGHTVLILDLNSGIHGLVKNNMKSEIKSEIKSDGTEPGLSREPHLGLWAGGADPRREGQAKGNN